MYTLVLFGSPRKQGFTSLLYSFFLKFMPKTDLHVVNCYKEMVKPCIGCEKCQKNFECVFDDMKEIYKGIEQSDVIIVASPIYNASFPAPLKLILDRLQPLYFSRHFKKRKKKKLVLLFSCGNNKIDYTDLILAQIVPISKILNAEICGKIFLNGTDDLKLDIDKFCIKSENKIKSIINKINNISN